MRVTVYTADAGGHDDVHDPIEQVVPPSWDLDWVFGVGEPWGGWEPFHGRQRTERFQEAMRTRWGPVSLNRSGVADDWGNRLLAKWAKFHPGVMFPEADWTVWIDASVEVTSATFVFDAVQQAAASGLGLFRHPDRSTVVEEAAVIETLAKNVDQPAVDVVTAYEKVLGRPVTGLWALGVMVRRNVPETRVVDRLVWSEVLAHSVPGGAVRDQIVLPYALEATGLRATDLQPSMGNLWANPWFVVHPHRRPT